MATKAEYLTTLDNRSVWRGPAIETPLDPAKTNGEIKLYDVSLLVQVGNTYQAQTQGFYVLDEGGPGETVYPVNAERQNNPPDPFATQLDTYLASRIGDPAGANRTIVKITQDTVDTDNEFAVVTAYIEDTSTSAKIVTQRFFVAKDGNGDAYIRPFEG